MANAPKPLVITLMGPTASGKTDLAIGLHRAIGAEIISVDSALVYRGMDIGTAKPTAAERAAAPHRLIDIRDPAEPYSAADFARDAGEEIERLIAQRKTPILVGGTMLYFKALLEGLADMPPADPTIRAAIERRAARDGWPALHGELQRVDSSTAAQLHPNHSQRICRALEVYLATGTPISVWRQQGSNGLRGRYDWLQLAMAPVERRVLHQRISVRFDRMLEQGFEREVRALFARGDLHPGLPSIRAVGYRQMWEYLNGEVGFDEMREKGLAATRQLAKRQLTWLRGWRDLSWVNASATGGAMMSPDEILANALSIIQQRTL